MSGNNKQYNMVNNGTNHGGMHIKVYNSHEPLQWTTAGGTNGQYTGETLEGVPHGNGTFLGKGDLSRYAGEWRNGLMHGQGSATFASGN